MTESEQKRIKAVQLYVSGKKVSSICKNLNKNRKWFYKWKNAMSLIINNGLKIVQEPLNTLIELRKI